MLYANTDDGSSALWVLNDDGVVVDNISIYGAERAPILEQINEHYGTSFTGWSDNEMGLRFGDTVPNWNAYEKIEMQVVSYYKYDVSNGMGQAFIAMEIVSGTVKIYSANIDDSDNLIGYNNSGQWITSSIHKTYLDVIAAIAQQQFEDYKGIERIVKGQENIPNWNEYSLLS